MALVCIDTESSVMRRYVPHVNAGQRKAWCTHEFAIERPQTDELPRAIGMIVKGVLPGMQRPTHENVPPTGSLA